MTDAIISLTSIPPRFAHLPEVLGRLVRGQGSVAEVHLYVPARYRRFPGDAPSLPPLPEGIVVHRTDVDFGPATKVLPALRACSGTKRQILFCDDDQVYPPGWAASLLAAQAARPDTAVALVGETAVSHAGEAAVRVRPIACRRPRAIPAQRSLALRYRAARLGGQIASALGRPAPPRPSRVRCVRAGYADILCGFGGAVVQAAQFDEEVFAFVDPLHMVDDVWLSGHLARRNVGIWIPAGLPGPQRHAVDRLGNLRTATIEGMDRKSLNRTAVDYFRRRHGVWG